MLFRSQARAAGLKAGLFRPVTLWPFPVDGLTALTARVKRILVVELNLGQMVEDVRYTVGRNVDVRFFGRPGGGLPHPRDIAAKLTEW